MKSIYSLAVSLVMLAACNNDVEFDTPAGSEPTDCLRIESVTQQGFVSEEKGMTRAVYEGYTLRFENQDRLGLILLDNAGRRIAHGSFRFEGGNWMNENKEGTQFFSGKTAKVIAYFPYDENLADDINSVEALKEAKAPMTLQNTEANFKQSDLLVCELSGKDVKAALNIDFSHAFSLIGLAAQGRIQAGDKEYTYNLSMSDVSMAIGEENYMPYVLDGIYVCLVTPDTELKNGSFRYFYNIGGQTYVKTLAEEKAVTPEAGCRYTFPCATGSGSEVPELAAGDFYCVTEDNGSVVVIPGNAGNIPVGLTCKGIVFHVMDATAFDTFASLNGIPEGTCPGYGEDTDKQHGLMASVEGGQNYGVSVEEVRAGCYAQMQAVADYNSTETANGWALTQAMKQGEETFTAKVNALKNHTEKLVNATDWYIPSYRELKYLIWGTGQTTPSGDGLNLFNAQLKKVNAAEHTMAIPSISVNTNGGSEFIGFHMMQTDGASGWNAGVQGGETIRPICAF